MIFERRLCLILFASVLAGCGSKYPRQHSLFEFRSSVDALIRVGSVQPLDYDPSCGLLRKGADATLDLPSQKIPDVLTITWWHGDDSKQPMDAIQSKVDLSSIPQAERTNHLLLEFRGDEGWSGRFLPAED